MRIDPDDAAKHPERHRVLKPSSFARLYRSQRAAVVLGATPMTCPAFPGAGTGVLMLTWPVVALLISTLGGPAMTVTYELARLDRNGNRICATS
jgi:hypothetical protein